MYKLTNTNAILRLSDNASIPIDERNSGYQEFLRWRDGYIDFEGVEHAPNTPSPADALVDIVVNEVTMRQARLALLQMDLLQTINAAINSMPEAAQIEWEYASRIERNNPLFIQLAVTLNFTEQQIDDFFTTANGL